MTAPAPAATGLETLRAAWAAEWARALARWSKFTRLSDPRWCLNEADEKREGLDRSFAMIRLTDQAVVVGLRGVREKKLERFAVEVLAHEVGHHVYCPANLTDHGRVLARMRRALPTVEALAPLAANLYADLLINDRLQRAADLDIAGVYRALGGGSKDALWTLYMRIYEILWSLPRGTLGATGALEARLEGDARLGARLIRSYAHDWLDGAGRFAALLLPYLMQDMGQGVKKILEGWLDLESAGAGAGAGGGSVPGGLVEIEPGETAGAIHPAFDEELAGEDRTGPAAGARSTQGGARGQHREPFEYGQILKSLGLALSDHDLAVHYYRERASPHLIRFPEREAPDAADPLPEGTEPWQLGSPIEEIDWLETVIASPHVIPGLTTVKRVWGTADGRTPERRPIDLDLYVDCSGSMPNPQVHTSYLALAGAIVVLSALRAGARVQATLWSGAGQFQTTDGFFTDAQKLLRVLTGYLGGGTAFPIHVLRDTYEGRPAGGRPVHILVISDDGVTTMFAKDEKNDSGWDVARCALERAGAGGTLVLNLRQEPTEIADLVRAEKEGWRIHRVRDWESLVAFARAFARANYERPEKKRRPA